MQLRSKMVNVIEAILKDYSPTWRFLKDAEIINDDPLTIKGTFRIDDSTRLLCKLEHVAIPEITTAVNQLERVAVAVLVESGYVEEWGPKKFPIWNKSRDGNEKLVISHEEVTFKDVIYPGKEFVGILTLDEERTSRNNNYHVSFNFEFDGGKHFGKVRICFITEDE